MKTRQQGFTLVELIVVIVILGILAATAIPRYAAYTSDARKASLNGLAGAVNAAVAIVQARYVATGDLTATTVTMADGTSVAVSSGAGGGIPTLVGIQNAVNFTGFSYDNTTGIFDFPTAIANCSVTYTAATGIAALTGGGSGC